MSTNTKPEVEGELDSESMNALSPYLEQINELTEKLKDADLEFVMGINAVVGQVDETHHAGGILMSTHASTEGIIKFVWALLNELPRPIQQLVLLQVSSCLQGAGAIQVTGYADLKDKLGNLKDLADESEWPEDVEIDDLVDDLGPII